jgi:hypothetical protein
LAAAGVSGEEGPKAIFDYRLSIADLKKLELRARDQSEIGNGAIGNPLWRKS